MNAALSIDNARAAGRVDPEARTAPVAHRRATVRADKAAAVAELAEAFRTASAAVLTEYRGLSVLQVTALRVALGADTTYSVVKNTLTRLAAADAGLEGLDALLSGPTAVAFVNGEPVEAARALRDYARTNPQLVVKGGVLDGKQLTAEEIRRLADLGSREALLAKMAGALKASLTDSARLFASPAQVLCSLLESLADATEDPADQPSGTPGPVEGTPDSDEPLPEQQPESPDTGGNPAAPAPGATPPEGPATEQPAEVPVIEPPVPDLTGTVKEKVVLASSEPLAPAADPSRGGRAGRDDLLIAIGALAPRELRDLAGRLRADLLGEPASDRAPT